MLEADLLNAIELVNEDKEQIMEQNATIVSQGGGGQAREREGCQSTWLTVCLILSGHSISYDSR